MRKLALAFVGLSACSSYSLREPEVVPIEPFGRVPQGVAQVCVVRPHNLGGLLTTTFRDNGVLVGATRGPSFFCYYAAPGRHALVPDGGDAPIATFEARAGERRFLHHAVNIGEDELLWTDPAAAESFLSECDYLVLEEVAPGERTPAARPFAPAVASAE
jgi:hypothetical protein